MLEKILEVFRSDSQLEKRVDSLESRLDNLESDVARTSDVELVRREVESLKSSTGSPSKSRMVRSRIISLVRRDLVKGDIKKKVVGEDSLCSESYFYENWNYLLDAGFIVHDDSKDSVSAVVEELPSN